MPVEDVEVDGRASVAEVAKGVGGDAANVHVNAPRHVRLEDLLLLSHRVVHPEFLLHRHRTYTTHLSFPLSFSLSARKNAIKP